MSGSRGRLTCGIVASVAAALPLSACGGGQRLDAVEPSGHFPLQVVSAQFPTSQTLSQHTHLVITVRNAGSKPVPQLAVTICNVTCNYPAPPGQGTGISAFGAANNTPFRASRSSQVWVVDRPPGQCRTGCTPNDPQGGGSQGGNVTSDPNTWALPHALNPGATATFDWAVTAVAPGTHVVAWKVSAGLYGKAIAVAANGSSLSGSRTVSISTAPAQSYVDNSGRIVTSP